MSLPMIIGITGGICSGKNLVCSFFKENGAHIFDADIIAKEICQPEKPAWNKIINIFGDNILNPDKTLNTKKLANIVFNDSNKLKELESVIHPEVKSLILERISGLKAESIAVINAPLLLEANFDEFTDKIIVVSCDEKTQIERCKHRDGLNVIDIKTRMARQIPLAEKVKKADFIINNNGSENETRRQFEEIWKTIKKTTK